MGGKDPGLVSVGTRVREESHWGFSDGPEKCVEPMMHSVHACVRWENAGLGIWKNKLGQHTELGKGS